MIRKEEIEDSIKESAIKSSRALVRGYILFIAIMIALISVFTYASYVNDPDFEFGSIVPVALIFSIFIIYALVVIIKNCIYLKNFEKTPVFRRLKKLFNLKDMVEFDNLDRKITGEIMSNTIFRDNSSKVILTNSYIVSIDLPLINYLSVYDASKLLMVEYNPIEFEDYLIKSRYNRKGGHKIVLYFEDDFHVLYAASKKKGEELCRKITESYKVLTDTNVDLMNLYIKDRKKFIQICREQAKNIYS